MENSFLDHFLTATCTEVQGTQFSLLHRGFQQITISYMGFMGAHKWPMTANFRLKIHTTSGPPQVAFSFL